MKTIFVCLANSKKYNDRCIAGIQLAENNDGTYNIVKENSSPKWIRPISNETHGAVASNLVGHIQMNDVVELDILASCPNGYQSENVLFDANSIKVIQKIGLSVKNLDKFTVQRDSLFNNRGKAVHSDVISELNYSLLFIKVEDPKVYASTEYGKNKIRMKFIYASVNYDLVVTDITFEKQYRANNAILVDAKNVYLTISLGILYEGWHHKLIAGVLYL